MSTNTSQLKRLSAMQSDQTEFRREIGVFGGVSIIGGIMIGSGIFYLGSYVLMRSGMSMGLALLCWVVGGIVTLLSGLCYAELGAMLPRAGGSYVYLREAYSPALAFMNGFSSLLVSASGSNAAIAIALAAVVSRIMGGTMSELGQKMFAIVMIVLLTGLNILGVKIGTAIQNTFMVAKLVPIIVIIGMGLFFGTQSPNLSIMPASNPDMGTWFSMLALGVVATLWAYEGWTNLNTVTEEIKNPKRNLPLSIVIAIVMVMVIYILFNFGIYHTLSPDFISGQLDSGNYYLGTETAVAHMGTAGTMLVNIGMLVSMFGSLNGCVMVFPRNYYAMANDGAMFRSFGVLHPKYKTPANALVASMVISVALVLMRNLGQLTSLVVFSGMVYNVLTFYAVIIFRKRYPELNRPYKVLGYPVVVYLTIAITVALMLNTLKDDPITSIVGLGVPAVGFVVYKLQNRGSAANA